MSSPYLSEMLYSRTGAPQYALTYGYPTSVVFLDEHGDRKNGRIMSRTNRFERDRLPATSPFFRGLQSANVEPLSRFVIPVNPLVFPYFDSGDYLLLPSPDGIEFFVSGFHHTWAAGLQWIVEGTLAPGVIQMRGCSIPGQDHPMMVVQS